MKAIVLHLQQVNEEPLAPSHGTFAYAAALELLLHLDPIHATHLHDPETHKPLTVSSVFREMHGDAYRPNDAPSLPKTGFHWRLTALEPDTARLLEQLGQQPGGVRVGNAVFHITGASTTPQQHPDAGEEDDKRLFERWSRAEPPSAITLKFITPTTFRSGAQEMPYPLPRLVFGSLMEVWSRWSSVPMGEWRALLERAILLSNWRGETRRVDLGNRYVTGFIGKFTYRPAERSRDLQRMMGMLAEFAFYTGVGWQTTHGLGQTRIESIR